MQSFFRCMHFNKCQLIERDLSRCYAPSLLESLQPRLVSEVHTRAVDDGHHPEQLARHLPVLPLSVVGDHMVPTSWCSLNNHFTEAQAISHLIRGATEVVAKVRVRFALPYMPTTCLFRGELRVSASTGPPQVDPHPRRSEGVCCLAAASSSACSNV